MPPGPVGAYGIVRFSPDLQPAWRYPKYTEVGPWDAISDCYALNVDDMSARACYDSDFPVVRIRDGTVTGWHTDAGRARLSGEYRVVLPGGEPLAPGTQVIGRGSRLRFLTGSDWYRLDVGDIRDRRARQAGEIARRKAG